MSMVGNKAFYLLLPLGGTWFYRSINICLRCSSMVCLAFFKEIFGIWSNSVILLFAIFIRWVTMTLDPVFTARGINLEQQPLTIGHTPPHVDRVFCLNRQLGTIPNKPMI